MRLSNAITEFLANELHLETSAVTAETTFAELGVDDAAQTDLLHRLQDALGIILPEDRVSTITTIGDVIDAATEQEDDTP